MISALFNLLCFGTFATFGLTCSYIHKLCNKRCRSRYPAIEDGSCSCKIYTPSIESDSICSNTSNSCQKQIKPTRISINDNKKQRSNKPNEISYCACKTIQKNGNINYDSDDSFESRNSTYNQEKFNNSAKQRGGSISKYRKPDITSPTSITLSYNSDTIDKINICSPNTKLPSNLSISFKTCPNNCSEVKKNQNSGKNTCKNASTSIPRKCDKQNSTEDDQCMYHSKNNSQTNLCCSSTNSESSVSLENINLCCLLKPNSNLPDCPEYNFSDSSNSAIINYFRPETCQCEKKDIKNEEVVSDSSRATKYKPQSDAHNCSYSADTSVSDINSDTCNKIGVTKFNSVSSCEDRINSDTPQNNETIHKINKFSHLTQNTCDTSYLSQGDNSSHSGSEERNNSIKNTSNNSNLCHIDNSTKGKRVSLKLSQRNNETQCSNSTQDENDSYRKNNSTQYSSDRSRIGSFRRRNSTDTSSDYSSSSQRNNSPQNRSCSVNLPQKNNSPYHSRNSANVSQINSSCEDISDSTADEESENSCHGPRTSNAQIALENNKACHQIVNQTQCGNNCQSNCCEYCNCKALTKFSSCHEDGESFAQTINDPRNTRNSLYYEESPEDLASRIRKSITETIYENKNIRKSPCHEESPEEVVSKIYESVVQTISDTRNSRASLYHEKSPNDLTSRIRRSIAETIYENKKNRKSLCHEEDPEDIASKICESVVQTISDTRNTRVSLCHEKSPEDLPSRIRRSIAETIYENKNIRKSLCHEEDPEKIASRICESVVQTISDTRNIRTSLCHEKSPEDLTSRIRRSIAETIYENKNIRKSLCHEEDPEEVASKICESVVQTINDYENIGKSTCHGETLEDIPYRHSIRPSLNNSRRTRPSLRFSDTSEELSSNIRDSVAITILDNESIRASLARGANPEYIAISIGESIAEIINDDKNITTSLRHGEDPEEIVSRIQESVAETVNDKENIRTFLHRGENPEVIASRIRKSIIETLTNAPNISSLRPSIRKSNAQSINENNRLSLRRSVRLQGMPLKNCESDALIRKSSLRCSVNPQDMASHIRASNAQNQNMRAPKDIASIIRESRTSMLNNYYSMKSVLCSEECQTDCCTTCSCAQTLSPESCETTSQTTNNKTKCNGCQTECCPTCNCAAQTIVSQCNKKISKGQNTNNRLSSLCSNECQTECCTKCNCAQTIEQKSCEKKTLGVNTCNNDCTQCNCTQTDPLGCHKKKSETTNTTCNSQCQFNCCSKCDCSHLVSSKIYRRISDVTNKILASLCNSECDMTCCSKCNCSQSVGLKDQSTNCENIKVKNKYSSECQTECCAKCECCSQTEPAEINKKKSVSIANNSSTKCITKCECCTKCDCTQTVSSDNCNIKLPINSESTKKSTCSSECQTDCCTKCSCTQTILNSDDKIQMEIIQKSKTSNNPKSTTDLKNTSECKKGCCTKCNCADKCEMKSKFCSNECQTDCCTKCSCSQTLENFIPKLETDMRARPLVPKNLETHYEAKSKTISSSCSKTCQTNCCSKCPCKHSITNASESLYTDTFDSARRKSCLKAEPTDLSANYSNTSTTMIMKRKRVIRKCCNQSTNNDDNVLVQGDIQIKEIPQSPLKYVFQTEESDNTVRIHELSVNIKQDGFQAPIENLVGNYLLKLKVNSTKNI